MALEIMITVGGSDYYLSDEGHSGASFGATSGSQYYFPFVAVPPRLTWGPTTGGYISVQAGTLTLVNQPYDSNHPFSGTNYRNLLSDAGSTSNVPTIAIKDSTKYAIFEGTLLFKQLTNETIDFSFQSTRYTNQIAEGYYNETIPWIFGFNDYQSPLVHAGNDVWKVGTSDHPGPNTFYGFFFQEEDTALYTKTTTGLTFNATEIDASACANSYSGQRAFLTAQGTKYQGDVTDSDDKTDTFQDLMEFVAEDHGFTVATDINTDKTGNSGSYFSPSNGMSIYQKEPRNFMDLFSEACLHFNHHFFITKNQTNGRDTFYFVDLKNNPESATSLTQANIISSSYALNKPLAGVIYTRQMRNWENHPPYEPIDFVWNSDNLNNGYYLKRNGNFCKNILFYLRGQDLADDFRDVYKKPIATVTVDGIQDTYTPGDRFTFNREQDQIKVDMLARSISWDWARRQTTLSGDATLSIFEDS